MIDGVSGSGLAAIQRGQQQAVSGANKVTQAGTTEALSQATADMLQGTLELKQAEQLTKAGSKLLSTSNEMMGNLLDVLA